MPTDEPTPPPLPCERKPWQFSLLTLLFGVTGLCVFLGLTIALPMLTQILAGIIWIAGTGWLITGLFFAKGDQRAFCIGAMVVVSSMWSSIGGRFMQGVSLLFRIDFHDRLGPWFQLLVITIAAVANGYFCVRARRYFECDAHDSA